MVFEAIMAETVSVDKIASFVRARVRRGSLIPGQRVIEAEIMNDTGGTRARVRTALQQLASEGIVVIEEFRGASIKRLSRDEVENSYRTREMLEGLQARLFSERGTPEAKAELARLQERMDLAEMAIDGEDFGRLNAEWHDCISRGAANPLAGTFLDRLRLPIFRMQFSMFFSREALLGSNRGHRVITAAILAGDGDGAEKAMRQHVREGLAAIAKFADEFFAR